MRRFITLSGREIYNGILSMLSSYTTAGYEWAVELGMAKAGGRGRRRDREGGAGCRGRLLKAAAYEGSGASSASFRQRCDSREIQRSAARVGLNVTTLRPRRNVTLKVGCQFER